MAQRLPQTTWTSETFGVGLGELSHGEAWGVNYVDKLQTCAVKNGKFYYGNGIYLGFAEIAEDYPLSVYPNPVSDKLTIQNVGASVIRISGILGNLFVHLTTKQNKKDEIIDVSGLNPG